MFIQTLRASYAAVTRDEKIEAKFFNGHWCRRGESNPRPRDYETLALPLSYAGTGPSCYGYRPGGGKTSAPSCQTMWFDSLRTRPSLGLNAGASPIKTSTKVPLTLIPHPPTLRDVGQWL